MKIQGYASHISMDRIRDVVPRGAFTQSIAERGLNGPQSIRLQWQHKGDVIIGSIDKLTDKDKGLWVEATINENISFGKDAAEMVRSNGGMSFSIGYRPMDVDLGQDGDGEYLILKRVDLKEISIVTDPCNLEAFITEYDL